MATSEIPIHHTFTRGSTDKLSGIGLGKLGLIKGWLEEYGVKNYLLNDDDSIDVDGSVDLNKKGLTEIPEYIQFRRINGSFFIGGNELKTCKGFPVNVKNNFDMEANGIYTLKYAPEYVGISTWYKNNHISDEELIEYFKKMEENIPKNSVIWDHKNKLDWHFDKIDESSPNTFSRGDDDKLTTLGLGKISLIKKWLKKYFISNYQINDDLTIDVNRPGLDLSFGKLEELPDYIQFNIVDGDFVIHDSEIETLKGCPKIVKGYFDFRYCGKLKSLEYAPEKVYGKIFFSHYPDGLSADILFGYRDSMKKHVLDESFIKGDDKLTNLGVGKIGAIKKWLEEMGIKTYDLRDDLSIDVNTSCFIQNKNLDLIPSYIKFNKINGNFDIGDNNLTSLRGCPDIVTGFFSCTCNNLSTIKFAPRVVYGSTWLRDGNNIPQRELKQYHKLIDNQKLDESFIKGDDKISNLGLGKGALIKKWLEDLNVDFYKINSDYTIDVDGNCHLQNENLGPLPEYIKFHKINGNFDIHGNNLSSLRGCPDIVKGYFDCTDNGLTSLKFAPDVVYSNVWLSAGNSIKYSESYEYILGQKEQRVNESFIQGKNKLEGLGIGKVQLIGDWLRKYQVTEYYINSDLTIDVDTDCYLSNHDFGPLPEYINFNKIHGDFDIHANNILTLRGCPKIVLGYFDFSDNKLTSLDYAPEKITGNLYGFNKGNSISNMKVHDYILKMSQYNNTNESFIQGANKLKGLGVGKINTIKRWLDMNDVLEYNINDDLTIDVNRTVDFSDREMKNFPDYIQFNKIKGSFRITDNEFTSLRGCPKRVEHDFDCDWNKLTSLEYAPEYVGSTSYVSIGNNIPIKELIDFKKKIEKVVYDEDKKEENF